MRLGILRSGTLLRANLSLVVLFGSYLSFQFMMTLYATVRIEILEPGRRLDVHHVQIRELREARQHPPVAAEMAGHAGQVSTEQERLASRRSQVFVKVGRLAWPPLSQIGSLIVNLAVKTYLVIVLLALPTVMFGGFSLLRLSLANRLNDYQRGMFRAGHAHAGVLLVLSLASVSLMAFIGIGIGWIWFLGAVLVVGALAQSGGFFLDLAIGRPDRWSAGTTLTVVGAVLLSIAMVVLAIQVATAGALR